MHCDGQNILLEATPLNIHQMLTEHFVKSFPSSLLVHSWGKVLDHTPFMINKGTASLTLWLSSWIQTRVWEVRMPPTQHNIQGGPKKLAHFFVRLITSSNIDNFLTFFSQRIRRKFVIILSLRSHHTWNVSLHHLVKCQCLKSNNWKQDFCNNTECIVQQQVRHTEHLM